MEEKKHSRFSIASFIMGVAAVILLIVSIIAIAYSVYVSGQTAIPSSEEIVMILDIALILSFFASSAGIILGIIGLLIENKKRVFALVGLTVSFLILMIFLSIIMFTIKNNII